MSAPAANGQRSLIPLVVAGVVIAAGLALLLVSSRSYVSAGPADKEPYNLLVEGFRAGHLWIAKEAPPGLASQPNPYLFAAYRDYLGPRWSLIDLSYYRGHLYTYFGATPALVLFWPWRALTGSFLHQSTAVLVFCLSGLTCSLGVAASAWRRYYPGAGPAAAAAGALLLASLSSLPVFVARPGLFEVSIGCAYAFAMASVACLWRAWHGSLGTAGWVAAASLLYGLAVASRPPILFGAAILLLPAASAFAAAGPRSRPAWALLAAAALPIAAVGAAVASYNALRFGDPLQFGHDYQLSGNDVFGTPSFSASFLWDNLRLYFLLPPRWHAGFPFVWRPPLPPLSAGHLPVEFFYGTLACTPAVVAAVLVPVYGLRRGGSWPGLPSVALLALFASVALPVCLYAGATSRYLLDFMPPLALLGFMGYLAMEDTGHGPSPAPLAVVVAVRAALAYSVAVAWLLSIALVGFYRGAEKGLSELRSGRTDLAAAAYDRASRMNPDFRGQADLYLGADLLARGRVAEAAERLGRAVSESPQLGAAHFNLGQALVAEGNLRGAAGEFARAAAIDPRDAEAEENLGVALFRLGDLDGAIVHLREALRLRPTLQDARRNLETLEAARGPAKR